MDTIYKRMTEYLVGMDIEKVPHTKKTYLGHLLAVHRLLESKGCNQDVCRAGMFHSVYGTQRFQGFKLSLECREEVRELIGERAERLAYLNCAMDRPTFDKGIAENMDPIRFLDRLSGEEVVMSREDCDDLCRIHFYDYLEQAPRLQEWDYRRDAYRNMAERLGGPAVKMFNEVFALEHVPAAG